MFYVYDLEERIKEVGLWWGAEWRAHCPSL